MKVAKYVLCCGYNVSQICFLFHVSQYVIYLSGMLCVSTCLI